MRLLALTLRNFKGIRELILNAQGKNTDVYGDNATGKTTINDAINWLLFDKDSQNKKDFAIKTLDENNQPIHGMEHEVEGAFDLNGKQITLRKVYKEKYTKQRGSATETFTGHTTDYFIDGVPVQLKEYQARIAEIADESIFKLLTSPTYFNEVLHWQKRREILLQVCGDVSDADVIASDPKLSKLPDVLKGRKTEEHEKVIKVQLTKINDELKTIPIRISEAQRNLPDISNLIIEALPKDIATLAAQIKEKQQELGRIESGGQIAELKKQLAEAETAQSKAENEVRRKHNEDADKLRKGLADVREQVSSREREIRNFQRDITDNEAKVARFTDEKELLLKEWYKIDGQDFKHEEENSCPACGQALPEEQVQDAHDKALASFNLHKSKQLDDINARGKELATAIKAALELIEEYKKKIEVITSKMGELDKEGAQLLAQITALVDNPLVTANDPNIDRLKAEICSLKDGNQDAIDKVKAEIRAIQDDKETLEKELAKVDQWNKGKARIEELGQQQKKLAGDYEDLQKELILIEQFTRAKVSMLTDKINSRFRYARFKLFEEQVNGGLVECCETLYEGVPYSSGLNNGHRGIVGLDIIDTLSEHKGFYPPIIYDNAESVTALPEMKSQMICLYVSEADKKLRVEVA